MVNFAALCQETQDAEGAVNIYHEVLQEDPSNVVVLNNLGAALISLGRAEAGAEVLQQALLLDPDRPDVLTNLGVYYQESGMLSEAREAYTHSYVQRRDDGLVVRQAIMLSPVPESEAQIAKQRQALRSAVASLTARAARVDLGKKQQQQQQQQQEQQQHRQRQLRGDEEQEVEPKEEEEDGVGLALSLSSADPVRAVERVHFYLAYHGMPDRDIQESIANMYLHLRPELLRVSEALFLSLSRGPIEEEERGEALALLLSQGVDLGDGVVVLKGATDATGGGGGATAIAGGGGATAQNEEAGQQQGVRQRRPGSKGKKSMTKTKKRKRKKVRVGFVSKFLGEGEPHGLLLEGVVAGLPPKHFTTVVCPLPSASGNALAQALSEAADEVVPLPGKYALALATLEQLQLDALVYGDMNGEPMTHFLGFARVAPVQALFWGNPISSGNPSIDYFISADRMEHPNRTRLRQEEEPYSEQVVLLGGQGIWYTPPVLPAELAALDGAAAAAAAGGGGAIGDTGGGGGGGGGLTPSSTLPHRSFSEQEDEEQQRVRSLQRLALKARLGLPTDAVVYMCPQSIFKLHPSFDAVVGRILQQGGGSARVGDSDHGGGHDGDGRRREAHVVFTEGRWESWTVAFRRRLEKALDMLDDDDDDDDRGALYQRVHFVPRTSAGEEYLRLLAGADVLLHPFPFGGSRTSSDGLSVGVPLVTLPTSLLRGRMAGALYTSMEEEEEDGNRWGAGRGGEEKGFFSSCCTAETVAEYVELAVRLGQDEAFNREVSLAIFHRSHLIWSRREVVTEWVQFLSRATGGEDLGHYPLDLLTEADVGWDEGEREEEEEEEEEEERQRGSRVDGADLAAPLQVDREKKEKGEHAEIEAEEAEAVKRLLRSFQHHTAQGRLQDAAQALDAALALRPSDAGIMNDLGATLQQLWRLEEAAELFTLSLSLQPRSAVVMANLGVTLQALARPKEAEHWFRQALVLRREEEEKEEEGEVEEEEDSDWAVLEEGKGRKRGDAPPSSSSSSCWSSSSSSRSSPSPSSTDWALFNLSNLLRNEGRLREAVTVLMEGLALSQSLSQSSGEGGGGGWQLMVVAVLAAVELRAHHQSVVEELQQELGRGGGEGDLWAEIKRLQCKFPMSTNNLVVAMAWLGELPALVEPLLQRLSGMPVGDTAGIPRQQVQRESLLLPRGLRLSLQVGSRAAAGTGPVGDTMVGMAAEGMVAEGVHLVVQYYVSEEEESGGDSCSSSMMNRVLDACILHNLHNEHIAGVHVLLEEGEGEGEKEKEEAIRPSGTRREGEGGVGGIGAGHPSAVRRGGGARARLEGLIFSAPPGSASSATLSAADQEGDEENEEEKKRKRKRAAIADKLFVTPLGRRMTFADAFRYANTELVGQVVVVANSDIAFLDDTLGRLGDPGTLDLRRKVFALLRWETTLRGGDERMAADGGGGDGVLRSVFVPRIDSQDCWIFRSPVSDVVVSESDFELGRPRCDNRLAAVFEDAGYQVENPSFSIRSHHVTFEASQQESGTPAPAGAAGAQGSGDEAGGGAAAEKEGPRLKGYSGHPDEQVQGRTAFVRVSDRWLF